MSGFSKTLNNSSTIISTAPPKNRIPDSCFRHFHLCKNDQIPDGIIRDRISVRTVFPLPVSETDPALYSLHARPSLRSGGRQGRDVLSVRSAQTFSWHNLKDLHFFTSSFFVNTLFSVCSTHFKNTDFSISAHILQNFILYHNFLLIPPENHPLFKQRDNPRCRHRHYR